MREWILLKGRDRVGEEQAVEERGRELVPLSVDLGAVFDAGQWWKRSGEGEGHLGSARLFALRESVLNRLHLK